jgi:hypothetical protein
MNEHPVTLHVMGDLRRSRLTVFFRFLLAIPHMFWLELWGVVVLVVFLLNWLVALIIGRPAKPFQRFTAAYMRYSTTVFAYMFLIANPFPGFTGERGSYPVELEVPTEPEKQNRLKTFFRIFLAYPAAAVSGALLYVTYFVTFLAWWAALITGRMPRGFRDLGANALRYIAQVDSYMFLITGRYPNASPYVGMSFEAPVATVAPAVATAPVTPEAPEAPSKK